MAAKFFIILGSVQKYHKAPAMQKNSLHVNKKFCMHSEKKSCKIHQKIL
jgi:hypothetical protein